MRRTFQELSFPLLALVSAHLLVHSVVAATLYVDGTNGDDRWTGNCEQWDGQTCGPKRTIQAAIDSSQSDDTVIVADGIYSGTKNRALTTRGKGITIRALNGPGLCVIDCEDAARGFVFNSGETSNTVIEGFTVRRGQAVGTGDANHGAGVFCKSASPTIRNCFIIDSFAERLGGGAYFSSSSATIEGCEFAGNSGDDGGGIYVSSGSPTIKNCRLIRNFSSATGGGLRLASTSATVNDCVIEQNIAAKGGGVHSAGGSASIFQCRIVRNHASEGGGAFLTDAQTNFRSCELNWNTANDGGGISGGGVASNCEIRGNYASAGGGASGKITLRGCTLTENEAYTGGGVSGVSQSPTLENCTVSANLAYNLGGALYAHNGRPIVVNTVLWGNSAVTDGPEIALENNSQATVSYSIVSGGAERVFLSGNSRLVWGEGNFDQDPHLVTADWHQLADSPCRDAGDPHRDYTDRNDPDGEARAFNERADIGADEMVDTDSDGLPNWWELRYFGSETIAEPDADDDADGLANHEEYRLKRNPVRAPLTFFVSPEGNDEWDGRAAEWNGQHGPKATVQAAIDQCAKNDSDVVQLADGVYRGIGNRELDYRGRALTVRSQNGPDNCVIDAEGAGRAFLFDDGEPVSAVVEGVSIRNGSATEYDAAGGCVYCVASSPTLRGCWITEGTATFGAAVATERARLTIDNCILSGEATNAGGAFFSRSGEITLENCSIQNSTSMHYGGGASINSSAVLRNCEFSRNTIIQNHGAALYASSGGLVIEDCTFIGNDGTWTIEFYNVYERCVVRNSNISNNSERGLLLHSTHALIEDTTVAGNGSHGIETTYSSPTIRRTTVTQNGGTGLILHGEDQVVEACVITDNGGTQYGGGIQCREGSFSISGCLVARNHATSAGAGIWCYGEVTISGCTITENRVEGYAERGGGGVAVEEGGPTLIRNSIIWNNVSDTGSQLRVDAPGSLTVTHCDVAGGELEVEREDNAKLTWGPGNIMVDPLFTRIGFHLLAGSTCRDAGDEPRDEMDIDFESRATDSASDIGTDEFLDSDADALPDWWEIKYFGDSTAGDPQGDNDSDGRLNRDEYAESRDPHLARQNYYVAVNGNDAWNGRAAEWNGIDGPKASIQSAIDLAHPEEGDVILIGDGVYSGAGNINLSFLGKAITVESLGGPSVCILDAGNKGRVVRFENKETPYSILRGVTITGGGTGPGGGVYVDGASPTIENCRITLNVLTDDQGMGAGIYALDGSPVFRGCVISANRCGGDGAGAYFKGGRPRLVDCVIAENRADRSGGGLYSDDSLLTVSRCEIVRNESVEAGSDVGGGGARGLLRLDSTLIADNSAEVDGGGVWLTKGSMVIGCMIRANRARRAAGGLAYESVFQNCTVLDNQAEEWAGGLALVRCRGENLHVAGNQVRGKDTWAGGIWAFDGTELLNCVIRENQCDGISSAVGGGILMTRGLLCNCSVIGNIAAGPSSSGGGVRFSEGTNRLINSVLWGNIAVSGSALSLFGRDTQLDISYSAIEGGLLGIDEQEGKVNWGSGNLVDDPLLAFAPVDCRLLATSPCIDAGTDTLPAELPDLDQDGVARRVDGNGDGHAQVDIGAFEYDPNILRLALSREELKLTRYWGDRDKTAVSLQIRNVGGGSMSWRIVENCEWLAVTPIEGDSTGESDEVVFEIIDPEIEPGDYHTEVTVDAGDAVGSPRTLPIHLQVSRILNVPADYATIQSAIDAAASEGDLVLLADGVYKGEGNRTIDLRGKSVVVRSEHGAQDCILDCEKAGRAFIAMSGEPIDTRVEGLTIRGAQAVNESGGAFLISHESDLTIASCIVESAESAGAGGAVSISTTSRCRIFDCQIIGCITTGNGGGIYSNSPATNIERTSLLNNSAKNGGGVYGVMTVRDSTIEGNTATASGGGAYMQKGAFLDRCAVKGNAAVSFGGGIVLSATQLSAPVPFVANSIFSGNTSKSGGGGVYVDVQTKAALTNCSFGGNADSKYGGAICVARQSQSELANCILFGDHAPSGPEIAVLSTSASLTVKYSDVQGGSPGVYVGSGSSLTWSDGNLDTDPLFAFSTDLRPLAASPCIDAGTSELRGGISELDVDGNRRTLDGNEDGSARVDMGAAEFNRNVNRLAVGVERISLAAHQGVNAERFVAIPIRRIGVSSLAWTASTDENWLTILPSGGVLDEAQIDIAVSARSEDLSVGTYRGLVTIVAEDASNGPISVPIQLNVARTLRVPSEYETIQAAIDVATDGELVLVDDGVYRGAGNRNISLRGRSLTVRSLNGPSRCILDCEDQTPGFNIGNAEPATAMIDGFTILHGFAASGAGIRISQASPSVFRCVLTAGTASVRGGGLYLSSSNSLIADCMIIENRAASSGGGVHVRGGAPLLRGCTIASNMATDEVVGQGGGVSVETDAKLALRNTVLWSNAAVNGPQLAGTGSGTTLSTAYCDVEGGASEIFLSDGATLTWDESSFDLDPLFIDSEGGNYGLSGTSPCVNAGDPTFVDPYGRDVEGQARVFDGLVDVGADEFAGRASIPADANCDGAVGFEDIDFFILALIAPDSYRETLPECDLLVADIDGDGSVSFDDIDGFVACIVNGGCP